MQFTDSTSYLLLPDDAGTIVPGWRIGTGCLQVDPQTVLWCWQRSAEPRYGQSPETHSRYYLAVSDEVSDWAPSPGVRAGEFLQPARWLQL